MSVRGRLIACFPFWVLIVASLALTGVGLWTVWDQLGKIEGALRNPPTDQAGQVDAQVNVYVGQPTAVVGAVILATGIIGLFLVLLISIKRFLAQPKTDDPATHNDETAPPSDTTEPEGAESPTTRNTPTNTLNI